jgi:hypothetical protein
LCPAQTGGVIRRQNPGSVQVTLTTDIPKRFGIDDGGA